MHVLRSAAAAVRAGKYTWGAAGKNACPDGTARIDDLTACKAAAAAAGKPPPKSSESTDQFPKGCYSSILSPDVVFNAHVTGTWDRIDPDIVLLCAGTGVPASPARPAPGIPAPLHRGRRHYELCGASQFERRPAGGASLGVLRPMRGTLQYLSAAVVLTRGAHGSMRVVPTVGRSIWYGSDRNADDRNADDRDADEPDDGSHATAGSGYAYRMGVSTSRMRHVRRRYPRRAHIICVCTQI